MGQNQLDNIGAWGGVKKNLPELKYVSEVQDTIGGLLDIQELWVWTPQEIYIAEQIKHITTEIYPEIQLVIIEETITNIYDTYLLDLHMLIDFSESIAISMQTEIMSIIEKFLTELEAKTKDSTIPSPIIDNISREAAESFNQHIQSML